MQRDKVRIGYTSPTPNHGVLWVADTSNLFKKNNLDLEIVYMPGQYFAAVVIVR